MKIVITMTSWTKRIRYVGKAIYRFLKTQTIKPDLFYLWLAEEEFPNKEADLPDDLLLICEAFSVKICWTKENEYCFKRWRVYPKHNEDMVISIDDDQIYDVDLIESCVKRYKELNKPCVISWQKPGRIYQPKNLNIVYDWQGIADYRIDSPDNYFIGQTCFTPNSFPVEIFEEKNWKRVREVCPKCDESVIHPFLIKNGIRIYFVENKQKMVEEKSLQSEGLMQEMHYTYKIMKGRRYKTQHVLKYYVLKAFPELQESWKKILPLYNFNELD